MVFMLLCDEQEAITLDDGWFICRAPRLTMSFTLKEEPKQRSGWSVLCHRSGSLFILQVSLSH